MPETIELARSVEYLVVNNQVMPDGFHQYKWTNPLNIPFSFKLHAFDREYCPQGALSLLQVASLLQSFALPLSGNGTNSIPVTAGATNPGAALSGANDSKESRGQSADTNYGVSDDKVSKFFAPVTLRLELVFTDEGNPGIMCNGYVKDVRTKLNGPWLRGPGRSQNLPSSAEYEFTFVHVPGYGNSTNIRNSTALSDTSSVQAFAADVRQKMYNTVKLTPSSPNYIGFTNAGSVPAPAAPVAPVPPAAPAPPKRAKSLPLFN